MTRPQSLKNGPTRQERPFDFWKRVREIDMFFERRGPEHKTLRRLVEKLEKANIPYAVVGGMAVNAHRHERTTNDVDILLTREGFERFCKLYVPKVYDRVPHRPRRFLDRRHRRTIDVLMTGLFPGSGKPGPVAYPDPGAVRQTIEEVQFVNLPTLVQLKLAARRYQDFADVVNLIRANGLGESFLARLHPSVERDFIECLEEKRREDEYETCQDRMLEEELRRDDPDPGDQE